MNVAGVRRNFWPFSISASKTNWSSASEGAFAESTQERAGWSRHPNAGLDPGESNANEMNVAISERRPTTEQISGVIERDSFQGEDSGLCVLRGKACG
jgi:hypothetical protein